MKRRLIKTLVLITLTGVLVFLFFARVRTSMVDFEVNYTAGKRLTWGETLYRVNDGNRRPAVDTALGQGFTEHR